MDDSSRTLPRCFLSCSFSTCKDLQQDVRQRIKQRMCFTRSDVKINNFLKHSQIARSAVRVNLQVAIMAG